MIYNVLLVDDEKITSNRCLLKKNLNNKIGFIQYYKSEQFRNRNMA